MFILCAMAIAFLATIPLGSAGFMASQLVAMVCLVMGLVGGLLLPRRRENSASPWTTGIALAVIGWCLLQLVRWPADRMGWIWTNCSGVFEQVAADAGSLSVAVDRYVSGHMLLLWLGLGLLAWACSRQISGRRRVALALNGLVWLGMAQSVYGVFFPGAVARRLQGTFGSPDALGGLLALTLPVTLGLVFSHLKGRESRERVLWMVFAFGIQLIGLFFTGSRGALVSALVACGALVVWFGREQPRSLRMLLVAGLLLAGVAVFFCLRGLDRPMLDRTFGDAVDLPAATTARLEIWRAAIQLCRRFPFGVGPGGTAIMLPMFQTEAHGRYRLDYAHNDYLQFLGDLGWPAFLALMAWLALVLRRGMVGARGDAGRNDPACWLYRGALLAVVAALIHAIVEFNLSARPGVQVVFSILCGVLWGSTATRKVVESVAKQKGFGIRLAVAVLGCAAAIGWTGTAARAWFLCETAAAAVGLEQDAYLFFPRPSIQPAQALEVMLQAGQCAPGSSFIRRSIAETRLALHEMNLQDATRGLLSAFGMEGSSNVPPETAAQARHTAELALAMDEAAMLPLALGDAERAVALAPWDAPARCVCARILLRSAALGIGGPDAPARALRDLENAVRLYPFDARLLAQACNLLAGSSLPVAGLDRLLSWGARAVTLDPSLIDSVINAWWSAHVPLRRVLEARDVSVALLWRIYGLLDRKEDAEGCRACLAALKDRLSMEDQFDVGAAFRSPLMQKRWHIRQVQHRLRWVQESMKYLLLDGDWAGLQAFSAEREKAWHDRLQMELDKLELAGPASPSLRRLRLRELDATWGLDQELAVEWARLELEAGASVSAVQDSLAEVPAPDLVATDDNTAPLNIGYRGRRMILQDAFFDGEYPVRKGLLLKTVWRFWGSMPADLQVVVSVRDTEGEGLFQKKVTVNQEKDVEFRNGMPVVGSTWTLAIPIPSRAVHGRVVQVLLKSGDTRLATDEGLTRVELAMEKLPRHGRNR